MLTDLIVKTIIKKDKCIDEAVYLKSKLCLMKEYVWNGRWFFLGSFFVLFLVYGTWIYNMLPQIDTEMFINTPYSEYGLQSGRPGKFLTSYIWGVRWFNPYVASVIGLSLFIVSGVLFGYLFYVCGLKSHVVGGLFVITIVCTPIMVEQMYFQLQVLETAWAYVLCAICVGLNYYGVLRKVLWPKFLSMVFMIWIFSTYQVFLVIYVSTVIFCYLLLCVKWNDENRGISTKCHLFMVIELILWFLVAVIVNSTINSIWFSAGSDYLNGQKFWGTGTCMQGLKNIYYHVKEVILGKDVFYTPFYTIFAIGAVVSSIVFVVKNRIKPCWLYVMAVLVLQITPFLLTVYLGQEPIPRTQLVYPLVLAFNIMYCIFGLKSSKVFRLIVCILVAGCLWNNLQITMRLIYTDKVREQEDIRLMQEIDLAIKNITVESKPVAFVGSYSNRLNNACKRGYMIGVSLFSADVNTIPHYLHSTTRICGMFNSLGYKYEGASSTQVEEARIVAVDMPSWPEQGSIKDMGGFLVIKLGEDGWKEEVVEASIQEVEIQGLMNENPSLHYNIESVTVNNDNIEIKGWMVHENISSDKIIPVVYFRNNETDQYYKIATVKKYRPDVSSAFGQENLYDWSGFFSYVPVAKVENIVDISSILLGYSFEEKNQELLIDTNKQLVD